MADKKMASRGREKGAGGTGLVPAAAFGLVACVLYGVGAGLRGDVGILLMPLSEHCGLTYQEVSLCIAVMNLVFGAAQPAFGMLAARRSNRLALLVGVALLGMSLVGMGIARSFAALFVSLGLLFGTGAGALAFGLILASSIRRVEQSARCSYRACSTPRPAWAALCSRPPSRASWAPAAWS